jgi:hypothetical protein
MIQTWPHRLAAERSLLAGLLHWPRACNLEPGRFIAAEHGTLYWAIQESTELLPRREWTPALRRSTYDDTALAIVRETLHCEKSLGLFARLGGFDRYLIEYVIPSRVEEDDVPDLVELVRTCPRCGK